MPYTLAIDDLSLLLLTAIILLALLPRFFPVTPAAHPLLFAKQADTSSVRRQGVSPVYRHWSTGAGARLGTQPEQGVLGVKELASKGGEGSRWIGEGIVDLGACVRQVSHGVASLLDGTPVSEGPIRIITCLTATSSTLLPLVLLNLLPSFVPRSGRKYQLVTCADAKFLSHALSTFNDAPILVTSLDKVEDTLPHLGSTNGEKRYWIVVPSTVADDAMTIPPALTSRVEEKGYKLITWASFLYAGRLLPKDADADAEEGTQPSDPAQVHSVVLLARAAGSLMGTDDPQVLTITNSNLTAGVTAILSLFPASHRPSSSRGGKAKDVFLTSVDPAQPFGLGIIMSALYVGADLVFIPPSEALDGGAGLPPNCPSPTVAFLSKRQLRTLTSTLAHKAKASALYPIARRQAQARLREGSVARAGGWADWAVWRAARAAGATQRLRAVVVTDGNGMSPNEVEDTFVHLAVPVMRTWTSGAATAPLTATHFFDFQLVPRVSGRAGASAGSGKQQATDKDEGRDRGENGVGNEGEGTMHVGPPGMNIEIEVRGPTIDVSLERGADPRGTVHVRGPTVLRQFESGFAGEEKGNKRDDAEWEGLEVEAVVRPNGTFVVL